jgi:uncharacterized membrane protein YfcA
MPISLIILLTICSVFTAILSAITGMGGGVVLLSIMTLFLPLNIIIPIHGVVQLISNSTRSFLLRKYINWPIFLAFICGLPIGVLLSLSLIKKLDSTTFPLLLIISLIFYTVFKPKKLPPINIPIWAFSLVGLAVGFLGLLVGATGPFIAPFFLRPDLTKEQIIATKSSVQIMGHLIKIPAFLHLGFAYQDYWISTLCLTIAAILGTKLGIIILGRISDKFFRIFFKSALFMAGVRLLWKIVTAA